MSDFSEMPLADKHRKKAIRRSFRDFLKRLDDASDEIDSVYALGRVACALEVLAKEFGPEEVFTEASLDSKGTYRMELDAKLGLKNENVDQWFAENSGSIVTGSTEWVDSADR